ncbi:uncharacterized protein LOC105699803 [Orussus abietinus]|uniref:uncharacterized protein LOC105699803 n=1 Tax=Orussus abietinus TaxID=222816 RepID=UPI0006269486|nr:uncharacterized protein LOC105699803 [Orussus abietinus]XP_012280543.1 uncharacterized protein LOC105699803 [Orussus abietinus]XP_012280544.1 uncharacterized protein LOC105699803 [Orussus abietinus]XP_012280545.1 uncharacterized protein LOC105699803 [Orussus abietinus]XP_012280546.1 uncharacterized protein LOC105699803 [Orussus abietinus]
MGFCDLFTSCCQKSTSYEDLTPDAEIRRRQQMEAAEKRRQEQERRGIGNIDAVRSQQRRAEAAAKRQELAGSNPETGLKWQVN